MFQTGYNIPEGYGYDFSQEEGKTYTQRFNELYMNNEATVCAKVTDVDGTGKVLYLDFGAGVKGICDDSFATYKDGYWVNKKLIGKIVNVRIGYFDAESKLFVCSRGTLQREAYNKQRMLYHKGTIVKAKIIFTDDEKVVLDIGSGIFTVCYMTKMAKYITNDNEYIYVKIKNMNKFNSFYVAPDDRYKLYFKVTVESKIDGGYIVSLIKNPDRTEIIYTDADLDIGQVITIKKVITVKYEYLPDESFLDEE